MVDLPTIPRRFVTTEPARSTVTASDVAAPYESLGRALDSAAGAVDNIAVRAAHEAALKAVTRDENGNLKIEEMPFLLGRAGDEYKRVAHQSYLAQIAPEISKATTEAGVENEGQPDKFAAWGASYVDSVAARQPTTELQEAVRQMATRTVGEVQNGLIIRQGTRDLNTAKTALTTSQQSIENDVNTMVRGGLDENSEAVKSRLADWNRLQADRRANPAFGYSQAQADYDGKKFIGGLAGQHVLYQTNRIANDTSVDENGQPRGGIDAALKFADTILTRTDINLPDAERYQYWSRANSELRALKAERTQDRKDAQEAATALSFQSATGLPVDPDQVERAANALRKAGDVGGAARLYASFARKPLNDDFGRQPLADQTSQLGAMTMGDRAATPRARDAYSFFVGRGYSPAQASGIVGNLIHESNLDPSITHDGGTGLGIAGWRGDRLVALKRFAAARGLPPTDFQTQLEFVDTELKSTEAGAGARLGLAATPSEAGAAFLHYERPLNYDPNAVEKSHSFSTRVALSRAVAAVNTGQIDDRGLATSPAGGMWLQANRRNEVSKGADAAWTATMKDWDEKTIRPADAAVSQIVDAARVSNNVALLDRIDRDMTRVELAQGQGKRSLPVQHASIGALNAAAAAGTLTPGQSPILKDLQRRFDAVRTGLENNPVQTTVANFPERFKPLAPINPADSGAFRAGLSQRASIAQFAAQNWQTPPLHALDSADLAAVHATLDSALPADKARIFGDMAAVLPESVRNATFAKLGEKGPAAMVDAYAGALYPTAPDVAAGIVTGWRAISTDKRFDPREKAKDFNAAFDAKLPASAFGIGARTSDTGAMATIKNAARAFYAFRSAQLSDTTGDLNETRLGEAIDAVTGGVLNHNGGSFIAPARGISQSQFDAILRSVTAADLIGVTTLGGAQVTPDYLRNSAKLESVGDGQYLVQLGNDAGKPIYAFANAHEIHGPGPVPFVLDLRGRRPATTATEADVIRSPIWGMAP